MSKKSTNKKILLLMGPQGSGNHLFSKIFALHSDVYGWDQLLDNTNPENYFTPHWQEPHNQYWDNIDNIDEEIMGGKNYAVVSASIPFWNKEKLQIPPAQEFVDKVKSIGIDIQPVIIGRDSTILTNQQSRLRGGPTWGCATQLVRWLEPMPFFVSTELLYLYKKKYVESLGVWLDFPVAHTDKRIEEILGVDSNAKYIHQAENPLVDDLTRRLGYSVSVLKKEIY
jgi:hypothetical protein